METKDVHSKISKTNAFNFALFKDNEQTAAESAIVEKRVILVSDSYDSVFTCDSGSRQLATRVATTSMWMTVRGNKGD